MDKLEWIEKHIAGMVEMYEKNQASNQAHNMDFMQDINHAEVTVIKLVQSSIKSILESKP
jgi:hypothetical protein